MRVAVYTDAELRAAEGGHLVDETFVIFAADLADYVEHVVLIGRAAAETSGVAASAESSSDPARLHRLRPDIEVVTLRPYESLSRPLDVLRSGAGALRTFWSTLGRVDAAWIQGPHPFAIVLAVMAMIRRRQVVFGVRQDFPRHQRARHPDRPVIHWSASAMEFAWRALAFRRPVSAVGPDLARNYRFSRPVRDVMVSLIQPDDIVPVESALERSYDATLNLLWVGRLDPEKNPLLLADMLPLLDKVGLDWRLVVCGDGSERRPLEEALVDAGLVDRVTFTGFVTLDQLHARYRQAHVLVHTSWTEGVPQVLFEGFAAGVPTVATDVGGVRESTRGAAHLVPAGDPQAIADAIERLATDHDHRAELIRRGNVLAGEHTSSRQLERLAGLFRVDR